MSIPVALIMSVFGAAAGRSSAEVDESVGTGVVVLYLVGFLVLGAFNFCKLEAVVSD